MKNGINNERFHIQIELKTLEFVINAKNQNEAKRKALEKLRKKNLISLIDRSYPHNKRKIWISEY